ncbi:MAG: hypothetical protein ABSE69_09200 [Roseiarcus sp.]|jgi:hypothetical protein
MGNEIEALRKEVAALRREVDELRLRQEHADLKARLAELEKGPLFMPFMRVLPSGVGWMAGVCPIERWPALAGSSDVRAALTEPVSADLAAQIAADLEDSFNRRFGIADVPNA